MKMCKKTLVTVLSSIVVLVLIACTVLFYFSGEKTEPPQPPKKVKKIHPLVPYIHIDSRISVQQHHEFLKHLTKDQKVSLWKALKGADSKIPENLSIQDLNKEFLWSSHHWLTYQFTDENNVDYTEIVKWAALKLDVPKAECDYATTFQLEHEICEKIFARMWDRLTPEQRKEVLEKSGLSSSNVAGYVTLTGAGMLTAIGTSAALVGFPFYILMAKTVAVASAAVFGASAATTISAVAFLTGPVGWCIAGAGAVAGSLLIGRADLSKTAAFIVQVHAYKVLALEESEIDYKEKLLPKR